MNIDRELSAAFKRGLEDLEAGLADVLKLLTQARAAGDSEAELRVMKVYCTLLSKAKTPPKGTIAPSAREIEDHFTR
jgi:hypothetical protein